MGNQAGLTQKLLPTLNMAIKAEQVPMQDNPTQSNSFQRGGS